MSGFGAVSAIPYNEISAYLDLVIRIEDEEDRQDFITFVECLDEAFLKDYTEKQKQQNKKSAKASPKRL